MADEQQTTGTHKTTQNARITSNARGTLAKEKLPKTVENLAVQQQGFPEGAVELSEEKSLQKPPADATALTMANFSMADDNKWMTMTRKGKLDTEIEEAINQGEKQRGGTPKRKETSNTATMSTTTLERRKRFQPTATRATQPIEEKEFQSAAELIK
eukprot:5246987-Ditylum_brightwellii.AAC.1